LLWRKWYSDGAGFAKVKIDRRDHDRSSDMNHHAWRS
jgi:hypothetical protein